MLGWLTLVGQVVNSELKKRMSLKNTRAIIDAIHSGELAKVPTETLEVFGL